MGKKLAKNRAKRDSVRRKSSENWAQTQRRSGRERQSGSNAKMRRKMARRKARRKAKASAKKGRWHDEAAESVYVCVRVCLWVCTTFCYPCWLTTPNFPQFPRGCCLCLRHIDFFRLPRAFPTLFSSCLFIFPWARLPGNTLFIRGEKLTCFDFYL